MAARRFALFLVKPSHYDDDGYVIQWWCSPIPSNTLGVLYGLARDCADRRVLGDTVEIVIEAMDETNARVRPTELAERIRAAGAGMVMLVGVQSNQFPRALDLARPLRARGIHVAIGGFHVSGVMAMLGGVDRDLDRAREMGVSLFAGEAEGRLERVLRDADAGALAPIYNYLDDLPSLAGAPLPLLPDAVAKRTIGSMTSFDAGRGCPFQCSFCTIINVQGKASRRRTPDEVERIVRANLDRGLFDFFLTDDNFARNLDWEAILDRLIHIRRVERRIFTITVQADALCHRIPRFIEKCGLAGVATAYIGIENVDPAALIGAKKRQNHVGEYREMLEAWHRAGIVTYVGIITGFPNDTRESILRGVEILRRELPTDIVEFFYLTPLPGSEDHQRMHRAGTPMDADLNNFDICHVTTRHPRMRAGEWERAYADAWQACYSFHYINEAVQRAMRGRADGSCDVNVARLTNLLGWFRGAYEIEGLHPLETGVLRRIARLDRRPGCPIEPVWRFYPRYAVRTVWKQMRWLALYSRLLLIYLRAIAMPRSRVRRRQPEYVGSG
jgi:radical SAM superfamily enzyme YgiQ (UPF0313 family)